MLTLKEILKSAKFEEMFHSTGCMCVRCQPPRKPTIEELTAEIERLTEENKRLAFMVENGLGPEDMERDIDGR